jgi:autotransporter translocation and assembly factor TamB
MLQRRISPAKKHMRRTLQVIALVGTLLIGIVALALIVSQTPWFRDWLRRFVVKQAGNYVNGTVSIGSLGGNLFYGVQLGDIGIDVNGERVVTLKQVEIKYSLAQLVSQGMTVQQIVLHQPYVLLRRDRSGWNVASLVKRQEQEADRQGPRRPLSMPDIEIEDGRLAIDDRTPSPSYRLPSAIDGVSAKAGFEYAPVHYSVTLDRLVFNGHAPDLTLQTLSGRFGTRGDDLNVEKLFVQTPQSSMTIDGVVRSYLSNPTLQVTASAPKLSLPEFAGVLPPLNGYNLHPVFDVKATGPQNDLQLALNVTSEAGAVHGTVTTDAKAPDLNAKGDVTLESLNLAPIVRDPAQKSDISGHARFDVRLAGNPAPPAAALDRLTAHVAFEGPKVTAAGYAASNVRATADMRGRRIGLAARANAYGGTATAKGSLTIAGPTGQPFLLDLSGSASHVNLAGLPRTLHAPRTTTDLNASAYHLEGSIARTTTLEGEATLDTSSIAGGTIVRGTTAQFAMKSASGRPGLQSLTYEAKGEVRDLNLQKVGDAFQIAALSTPEYDSRIKATFDVKGSGVAAGAITIDATGTATESRIYGGTLPRMAFDAHLANTAFSGRAEGDFRGFDPSRLTKDPRYAGEVSGHINAAFGIADTGAPLTPDAITVDGQVTLAQSRIAGVQIDSADVEGQYANRRGALRQATVKGPGIAVQASGPIALDQSGQTNVSYHVAATDLASVGKLANQPDLSGAATLDGAVTGNSSALTIAGKLDGSNLGYRDNKALDLNSSYTVSVPDLDFTRVKVQAQSTGTFIEAAGLQIQSLTAATTYENRTLQFQTHLAEPPSTIPARTPRELDATGSVIFHPDHSEIHLPSLALRTQGVEWKMAPGSQAAIEYGANRVALKDVKLVNADQALDVEGSFSLGDNPQLAGVTVTARNVDIVQLEKLAMQDRGFTGRLNANATINGNAKAPDVTGHLAVENGAFQQFKYQSLTADGTFSNHRIGIDAKLVQAPGLELTAKGTVPLSALQAHPAAPGGHVEPTSGESIDLHVQSTRIDLGIIQGFTTQVTNVTGTVQADVAITGTAADPHLAGYVDFQNGAFAVPEANTRFTGMTTRIELQPDRIRVPRFQVLDEHGNPLTIQGDLAVHEGQGGAVNVSIEANDFKLFDNELGDVHLETHLRLTGEVRKPRVEGDLRTDAARLEIDKILLLFANPYSEEALPDVVSAQQTVTSAKGADEATRDALARGRELQETQAAAQNAAAPELAPKTGIFSATELNVHLVAPDNVVLRGTDIRPGGPSASAVGSVNATMGADLRIVKRVDGPVTISGTANTVRGFYEFQGRRFTLLRDGTLQFHGTPDNNPVLDIRAERLIPNTGVTAQIRITGTPRSPQLALSSTPPLDEADVLSLIVFNRSVNELGSGERTSLAETAGGVASGFVASSLGKSIGKALDVDLFEITTSDPDTGETAGGVSLGKQVSDKAFVRFRQQFGQRSFSEFMMEYQLAKFLRLDTRLAPETSGVANRLTQRRVERAGVDLIFFFSY